MRPRAVWFHIGILLCLLICAPVSHAETRSDRLAALFVALHDAETEEAATHIADQIQTVWAEPKSDTVALLMQRATHAMDKNDLPVAIELLNRVIANEPDFVEGWNRRATAFYLIGDQKRSLADIAETLSREPRHFGALSGLGMILAERGDYAHARAAFERARTLYPLLQSVTAAIERIDREMGASAL